MQWLSPKDFDIFFSGKSRLMTFGVGVKSGCGSGKVWPNLLLKNQLTQDIADYFAAFRERKKKITDAKAKKVLEDGAKKAAKAADKTLKEVKEKIGLI